MGECVLMFEPHILGLGDEITLDWIVIQERPFRSIDTIKVESLLSKVRNHLLYSFISILESIISISKEEISYIVKDLSLKKQQALTGWLLVSVLFIGTNDPAVS